MVKKLIVFLFVVGMGIGSLSAQLAKTCFTNMPDSLSPLLTAVNRADFIAHILLNEDRKYGDEQPFRTYYGKKYQGGYSDHLPVWAEFRLLY